MRSGGRRRATRIEARGAGVDAVRAVVVSASEERGAWMASVGASLGLIVERVSCFGAAEAVLSRGEGRAELALLHVGDGSESEEALALTSRVSGRVSGAACVFVSDSPGFGDAVGAMRAGAVDFVDASVGDRALVEAVEAASRRVMLNRERERRIERLRGVCRTLDGARHSITDQVSDMCTDLVDAYRELSTQIDAVALVGEYNGIARQELEVESLLRVTLEFVLAKTVPCNAAVYLPSSGDEFSLGAFVNFDREPAAMSVLLDRLGDVLAPRMEELGGAVSASDDASIAELLGSEAHWLDRQDVVALACEHEGECLAVVVLFRDARSPLPRKAHQIVSAIGGPFARQLGRIIRVHHRHLPADGWPGEGYGGGVGGGGLAA